MNTITRPIYVGLIAMLAIPSTSLAKQTSIRPSPSARNPRTPGVNSRVMPRQNTVVRATTLQNSRVTTQPSNNKVGKWINKNTGKIKTQLKTRAAEEAHKNREFDVLDVKIGDKTSLGFRAEAQWLGEQHLDAHQKAYKSQAAQGEVIEHVAMGGGVTLGGRLGFSTGNFSFSLSPQAGLKYRHTMAVPRKVSSVKKVARKMTVELPLTRDKMMKMKQGDEVVIEGYGRIGASAGVGVGSNLASFGNLLEVNAHAGASITASKRRLIRVTIKKLDADKVMLKAYEVKDSSLGGSVGLGFGVNANSEGEYGSGKLSKLVYKEVDKTIEDVLRADFSASMSRNNQHKEVSRQVVDLRTNKTLSNNTLDERTTTRTRAFNAKAFSFTLLSAAATGQVQNGTLTVNENGSVETYRTSRGAYNTSCSGFFPQLLGSGDQHFNRQLISLQKGSSAPQYHAHLSFGAKKDRFTRDYVIDGLFNVANVAGAVPEGNRNLGHVKAQLKDGMQRTSWDGEWFVTHEGLSRLATVSQKDYGQVFGEQYRALSGDHRIKWLIGGKKKDAKQFPWLNTQLKNTKPKDYAEAIRLLAAPAQAGPHNGSQGNQPRDRYMSLTSRDYEKDRKAYKAYTGIMSLITKVRAAGTAEARAKTFVSESKDLSADLFVYLSVVAKIAKPSGILIKHLNMKGEKDRITFKGEGVIADPQVIISNALNVPPVQ